MEDLCILYEVTNYKDKSVEPKFWDQYLDYFELGYDESLIQHSRLDLRALEPQQRHSSYQH